MLWIVGSSRLAILIKLYLPIWTTLLDWIDENRHNVTRIAAQAVLFVGSNALHTEKTVKILLHVDILTTYIRLYKAYIPTSDNLLSLHIEAPRKTHGVYRSHNESIHILSAILEELHEA